jgi:phage tail-like protein
VAVDDDYPPVAFYFAVRFGKAAGIPEVAFQKVSGLALEMETEALREGGENRFVHNLPKGVKPQRLVLERGVAAKDSGLVKWCKAVLEGGLALRIKPQQLDVVLLDAAGEPLRSWSFDNAYPLKWSVSELRADRNALALETLELNVNAATRSL